MNTDTITTIVGTVAAAATAAQPILNGVNGSLQLVRHGNNRATEKSMDMPRPSAMDPWAMTDLGS